VLDQHQTAVVREEITLPTEHLELQIVAAVAAVAVEM
jgi:hypothetical protein